MTDVILYHGLASTCSKKVRLALYEKGVAFESRLLDLRRREQRDPAYLALNPDGVVPTLVHKGRAIVESSIILEYVDDAFDGPELSPADPAGRAAMRLWLRYSDTAAFPSITAPTWKFMQGIGPAPGPAGAGQAAAATAAPRYSDADIAAAELKMAACISRLEQRLATVDWLLGGNFTLADAALLPFAHRIRNLRPEFVTASGQPAVAAWLARAAARPSFERALHFSEDPRAGELPDI